MSVTVLRNCLPNNLFLLDDSLMNQKIYLFRIFFTLTLVGNQSFTVFPWGHTGGELRMGKRLADGVRKTKLHGLRAAKIF